MHSQLHRIGWFTLPLVVFALLALLFQPLVHAAPTYTNGQDATLVLGQTDFDNQFTARMEQPFDVAIDPLNGKVFVADHDKHRVLRYASLAHLRIGVDAEAVLGQPNFTSTSWGTSQSNR
jgi:hypothetical protein